MNSESQKELKLQNDENDSSDDDMDSKRESVKNNEMSKRNNAIMKALETKRRKNKCKKCGGIGHFVPDCPTLTQGEREWHERVRQQNREKRKERSKKHVEFEGEFDILNSPCGLTIKQAMKYIPTYKRHVKKAFRKGKWRNIDYIKSSEEKRCRAVIEGKIVEAIMDSGAEVTAISKGLMRKIGYQIDEPSRIIIKSANDQRDRSLGKINQLEILLEGEEVIIDVEVIENSDELLILGNDWIRKNVKNIDIENKEMRIKGRYGTRTIPIELTRENDEEEYEDEDLDEVYC